VTAKRFAPGFGFQPRALLKGEAKAKGRRRMTVHSRCLLWLIRFTGPLRAPSSLAASLLSSVRAGSQPAPLPRLVSFRTVFQSARVSRNSFEQSWRKRAIPSTIRIQSPGHLLPAGSPPDRRCAPPRAACPFQIAEQIDRRVFSVILLVIVPETRNEPNDKNN
jgi:hypothetical protein